MGTAGEPRETIQRLLVTGDNRLKQGVAPEKVRESYLAALDAARAAGLEEVVGHGARSAAGLPTEMPGLAEFLDFPLAGGAATAATAGSQSPGLTHARSGIARLRGRKGMVCG